MKYLVNRVTKEHLIAGDDWADGPKYKVVEADAEGWIKWEGRECPLPNDARCEVRFLRGETSIERSALALYWQADGDYSDITHYRPILDKQEALEQPECTWPCEKADCIKPPESITKESSMTDILSRLDAAYEAASQIPDILAELRERLSKHGYDLVVRDPFANGAYSEQDVSDWRSWRKGDLIECILETKSFTVGRTYEVKSVETADYEGGLPVLLFCDSGNAYWPSNIETHFRFHSRSSSKND